MKVLILGTSYVKGPASVYLFNLWRQLTTALNPECDLLVVDSASPDLPDGVNTIRFADDIGHLGEGSRDGAGRAWSTGLEHAIAGGYDYVVNLETDLLFARPVMPVLRRMREFGVKIASPLAVPYQFIEPALMFMEVAYIRGTRLVERYDWPNSPMAPISEVMLEGLIGADFWPLLLRGCRNDMNQVTANNIGTIFDLGCDWITHCKDLAVYRAFLKMNGFGELAR